MSTATPTTTTYVQYLHRGLLVSEESSHPVRERDAARCAREASAGTFAFRFYDEVTGWIGDDPVEDGPVRESPLYYIDAGRLTAADVEALPGDYSVLLDNMRSNQWPAVARCRTGNFQPLRAGDMVISSETGQVS